MNPSRRPPMVVNLDDNSSLNDAINALSLRPFIAGEQPWARTQSLQRVRADAPLLPPAVEPSRVIRWQRGRCHLAQGDGWTLQANIWNDSSARLLVIAETEELAEEIIEAAAKDACEPPPPRDVAVEMGFWHRGNGGGKCTTRSIAIDPWNDIRRNYTGDAAQALERVMTFRADNLAGRLLLLHGPPGTGKTTALRALANAWDEWCQMEYVLDPELLLRDTSYLMSVLMGEQDDTDGWRVLVLEDCDELIRAGAKNETGQALSRLLNLTDGLVGQGLEVLVCITTNEHLHKLHPAIIRPGRCLAEIFVGPLTSNEANAWLGEAHNVNTSATLAELYALQGDINKVEQSAPSLEVGQYL